jgi:hypothetical protein
MAFPSRLLADMMMMAIHCKACFGPQSAMLAMFRSMEVVVLYLAGRSRSRSSSNRSGDMLLITKHEQHRGESAGQRASG